MSPPWRLDELLRASARRSPGAVAVEDAESTASIVYADLEDLATRFADRLVEMGVVEGDRVGICAPKSIATVAAIFGILRSGAAYVPVDAGGPLSRAAYILRDCSVKAVFVAPELASDLSAQMGGAPDAPREMTELEPYRCRLQLMRGVDSAPVGAGMELTGQLSYILYTSGSTGRPKGVVHTHHSALSFVDWCSETFSPSERDRFSSHAPFHFDLSILDLFVPIKHGATLVLIGESLGKTPQPLAAAIAEWRITVWYSTPSILRLLLEYGRLREHAYADLRIVLFAGEVFPAKHLVALRAEWPRPRFYNLYGPTETNVCTWYEVPRDLPTTRTEPFPIGVTCGNDRTRVVDEAELEVRAGEEGELYVAGGSVMQGYWNLPERTTGAFFTDTEGARWYRTGDIVREDGEGNYLFLGRRDRMVKRRGYRVELGEIEAALHRHPQIKEVAVVAIPSEESGVLVHAHIALDIETVRPSLVEIKQFCARNLPLYMIPDRFFFGEALPRTSTDKIDYQTLKALA